ncbi:hypothetical protein FBY36_1455 [Arthrobacter sp. SLBN-122]|nr:hypothetical protein FBY36_1455 [Arthrobacter sp. SLBN-122]
MAGTSDGVTQGMLSAHLRRRDPGNPGFRRRAFRQNMPGVTRRSLPDKGFAHKDKSRDRPFTQTGE